ncbi:MAG TPA: TIGR04283 family arsenosugar biosynthesis glycosyltransferase [Gammaproteobacteria bacterium]|nr:TIGR04283 family arsenosugar biosynthesis glycosyltransferase [Gammaproteobacteria bacterium]
MRTLSVCIPVLNEAASLPRLLAQLHAQQDVTLDVVVADGGSTDGCIETLPPGVRLVVGQGRGRGAQLNAAARMARGDMLLFLHADSWIDAPRLLANAMTALLATHRQAGYDHVAAHFPLRFQRTQGRCELLFRYMEAKTRLNRPGTINGDQGMLMSRNFFESLGGFDETRPFLEDQDMAARVFATGRWITLPGRLGTSARRFESLGPWRVYAFMAMVMIAWHTGSNGFLARVPALYAARLDRRAVWKAWRQTQRERRLSDVARYVGRNLWQIVFFVSTCFPRRSRAIPESARAVSR